MEQIFVDTSAWFALLDKNCKYHSSAYNWLKLNRNPLITTNCVFYESITLIKRELGHDKAVSFGMELKKSNITSIVWISGNDEQEAWKIFKEYHDKGFSFIDCISFAFMKRLNIFTAFAYDRHFSQIGFKLVTFSCHSQARNDR